MLVCRLVDTACVVTVMEDMAVYTHIDVTCGVVAIGGNIVEDIGLITSTV